MKEPEEAPFSVWDLIQQARELAVWIEKHRADRAYWQETFDVQPDETTVGAMIEYLQGQLGAASGTQLDGTSLLNEQMTASRRSCLFLGMLELAREQQLQMEQWEVFGGISVRWTANAETVPLDRAANLPT